MPAHAQARAPALGASPRNPVGKGIPMTKPRGAMNATVAPLRSTEAHGCAMCTRGTSAAAYTATAAASARAAVLLREGCRRSDQALPRPELTSSVTSTADTA